MNAALASQSVDDLELPLRASTILWDHHIRTIGQLSATTERKLLLFRGIGPASVAIIKDQLARKGLHLRFDYSCLMDPECLIDLK